MENTILEEGAVGSLNYPEGEGRPPSLPSAVPSLQSLMRRISRDTQGRIESLTVGLSKTGSADPKPLESAISLIVNQGSPGRNKTDSSPIGIITLWLHGSILRNSSKNMHM
jgi:hypothetical protein